MFKDLLIIDEQVIIGVVCGVKSLFYIGEIFIVDTGPQMGSYWL